MTTTIEFLGASGTVTGSKYLVRSRAGNILIDCGLFQGNREERELNWDNPPFSVDEINCVLITHAHIDHIGMLPRYSHLGMKAPIYASAPTHALSKILLPDSAMLQEEEAIFRERKGLSRHHPPKPLYTVEDANSVLSNFRDVSVGDFHEVLPGVRAQWKHMGHIIGACSIRLEIDGKVITFSGDIGRYSVPILKDPEPVSFGDLLLVESTYGDREHPDHDPKVALAKIINETTKKSGIVIIPSFAVGRTQLLLFYLRELKNQNLIPDIPVIVDSPMAVDATSIYQTFPSFYDNELISLMKTGFKPFSTSNLYFVRDSEESKKLNKIDSPMILISASGMLSGGRILHHLFHRVGDPRNTVLLVGYQPAGSRGDWLRKKSPTMRFMGRDVPVRCNIAEISSLSAHGDKSELLRWCKESEGKPGKVAVVHGDDHPRESFAETLRTELNWDCFLPEYHQRIEI